MTQWRDPIGWGIDITLDEAFLRAAFPREPADQVGRDVADAAGTVAVCICGRWRPCAICGLAAGLLPRSEILPSTPRADASPCRDVRIDRAGVGGLGGHVNVAPSHAPSIGVENEHVEVTERPENVDRR